MAIDLRPGKVADIIGNTELKELITINVSVCKSEGEPYPHCIFTGYSGCGKSTFAKTIAGEMGTKLWELNAAGVKKNKDLLDVLVACNHGDVLYIDEIHGLKSKHEELLYPAMEDFQATLMGSDVTSSNIVGSKLQGFNIKLKPFTLVGATTNLGNLSTPFRNRFHFEHSLDLYSLEEIKDIVTRSAGVLKIGINDDAAYEIARRSKATPRLANARVLWCSRFAKYHKQAYIRKDSVIQAMQKAGVDENGYDKQDLKYLDIVREMQPVGVSQIAARMGTMPESITKFIEPFLINSGIIQVSREGRTLSGSITSLTDLEDEGFDYEDM